MTASRERGIRFLSRFAFLRRKARLKGRGAPRLVQKSAGPELQLRAIIGEWPSRNAESERSRRCEYILIQWS
jgi:hypothetical protein